MLFRNRYDAGRQLASRLLHYAGREDVIVLALPRGGVPVGYEVAEALGVPLDVFMVRKLGVPGHEELAMGAIASGGVRVLNDRIVKTVQPSAEMIDRVAAEEGRELQRREKEYRDDRPPLDVRGKVVILADDGLATGATMRAAVTSLRQMEPARIVVAAPVAAAEIRKEFDNVADEVICIEEPDLFHTVGQWYEDFSQTTDEEVRDLLTHGAAVSPS